MADHIELYVYSKDDPNELLDVLNGRVDPMVMEELRGNGGGSFKISLTDPKIVENPALLDYRNFYRFKIGDRTIGAFIGKKKKTEVVGKEASDEFYVISGAGPRDWLNDAIVYPEGGLKPTSSTSRSFNFSSKIGSWYKADEWKSVVSIYPLHGKGSPLPNSPEDFPKIPGAQWIWGSAMKKPASPTDGRLGHPNGKNFFRGTFTVPAGGKYTLYIAGDDRYTVYLDGAQIAGTDAATLGYVRAHSQALELTAGEHVLGVMVENVNGGPGGLLAALYKGTGPEEDDNEDSNSEYMKELVWATGRNNSMWKVNPYPKVEPGWTAGEVMLTLIDEAKKRGVKTVGWYTPSFTATTDSRGVPWSRVADWTFGVGSTLGDVLERIEELFVDGWVHNETLVFNLAEHRGADKSGYGFSGETITTNVFRNPEGGHSWQTGAGIGPTGFRVFEDSGTLARIGHAPERRKSKWAARGVRKPNVTLRMGFEAPWERPGRDVSVRFRLDSSETLTYRFYAVPNATKNRWSERILLGTVTHTQSTPTDYAYTFKSPATAPDDPAASYIVIESTSSNEGTIDVSDVVVVLDDSTTAHPYWSGDSPNTASVTYGWAGEKHNSPSLRRVGVPSRGALIFEKGKNLQSAVIDGIGDIKNHLIVRTEESWFEQAGGSVADYGRVESILNTSLNVELSKAVASEVFKQKQTPEEAATYTLVATEGHVPFVDFFLGDWVLAPDSQNKLVKRRVVSLSAQEDDAGNILHGVEFDTVYEDFEARVRRFIEREGGTIGGAFSNASSGYGNSLGKPVVITNPSPSAFYPMPPATVSGTSEAAWDADGFEAYATVDLQWAGVTTNTDGTLTVPSYYEVEVKESDKSTWILVGSTSALSLEIPRLLIDRSYDFRVRAFNTPDQSSEYSPVFTLRTAFPNTPMGTPSAPTLDSQLGVIMVTWDGLLGTQIPPAQFRYVFAEFSSDGVTWKRLGGTLQRDGRTMTVANQFTVGSTWRVRLTAVDGLDIRTAPSAEATVVVKGVSGVEIEQSISDKIDEAYENAAGAIQDLQDLDGRLSELDDPGAILDQMRDSIQAAQDTADGLIQRHYSEEPPWPNGSTQSPSKVGDLWLKTSTAVAYRWTGTLWDEIPGDDVSVALREAREAQDAAEDAMTAATQAKNRVVTFYSPSEPTGDDVVEGVLWIDTDAAAADRLKRRVGNSWVSVTDAVLKKALDGIQTLDNEKITTHVGTTAPTGMTAADAGDIWIDTGDKNKMHRWSGSAWVLIRDTDIEAALALANQAAKEAAGKITTFYVAAQPTANGVGDLWVKTDAVPNQLRRWNGSTWEVVTDSILLKAYINASDAQATADKKIQTFAQDEPPANNAANDLSVGDIWLDTNDGNKMHRWSGTAWTVFQDRGIVDAQKAAEAVSARGENLITNGSGELGDTTNIYGGRYAPERAPSGVAGAFERVGYADGRGAINAIDYVSIDPSAPYLASARMLTAPGSLNYLRLKMRDVEGRDIARDHAVTHPGTITTLAAPLNPGDTTITLTSGANWLPTLLSYYSLGVWPYVNGLGQTFQAGTYTRNVTRFTGGATVSGNVITLSTPWAGPAVAAGKTVSLQIGGDSAITLKSATATSADETMEFLITQSTLWSGTAKIQLGTLLNWNNSVPTLVPAVTSFRLVNDAPRQAAIIAKLTADSKNKTHVGPNAPTAPHTQGDLWVDTTNVTTAMGTAPGNILKRWSGSAWVALQDRAAIDALALAGAKSTTWYQTTTPTGSAVSNGDLWINTAAAPADRLKRLQSGVWVSVTDIVLQKALESAQAAADLADRKVQTFAATTEPANNVANDLGVGDLWIDTDNKNKLHRWNGTIWEVIQDTAGLDAAATAQTTADLGYWQARAVNAKLHHPDTTFKEGVGGLTSYRAGGGGVALTRVAAPAGTPTTSGFILQATDGTIGNSSFTGFYPFPPSLTARPGAIFLQRFVAKIPVGYSFASASNAVGSAPGAEGLTVTAGTWLTPTAGTGEWQTYIKLIVAGTTGSFSSTGHVYVTGPALKTGDAPITMQLAQHEALDITDTVARPDILIQSTAPSADMQKSTTLWIDTTGGNNTPKRWNGTAWVEVTDKAAKDAAALAGTKGKVIIQSAQPAVEDRLPQNLWIDTTAIGTPPEPGNVPKRWSGAAWVAVQDKTALDAAAAARSAQLTAEQAVRDASTAQTSANGKNNVIYSTLPATGTKNPDTQAPNVKGDVWFQQGTADGVNGIIGQWQWTGSAWTQVSVTHEVIASLDLGNVTVVGKLSGNHIEANSIAVEQLLVTDFQNYFNDPTFSHPSGGLGHWTRVVSGGVVGIERYGTGQQSGHYVDHSEFPVSPGEQYRFSATRQTLEGPASGQVTVHVQRLTNGTWTYGFAGVRLLSDGRTIGDPYTVPENTTKLRVGFYVENTIPATTKVRLTDITIRRMTGSTLIEDGAITTEKIYAGAVTAKSLGVNSVTAEKILIGDFTNLIENANFDGSTTLTNNPDTSTPGWVLDTAGDFTSAPVTIANTSGLPGRALYFTGTGEAGLWNTRYFDVEPLLDPATGVETMPEFWLQAKTNNNRSVPLTLSINWFDQNKNPLATSVLSLPKTASSSTWTIYSGTTGKGGIAAVPLGARYGRVYVNAPEVPTSATAWLGQISVRRKTNGALVVDGSITGDHLQINSITADKIGFNQITGNHIQAGEISVTHINSLFGDEIQIGNNVTIRDVRKEVADEFIKQRYAFDPDAFRITGEGDVYSLTLKNDRLSIRRGEDEISWWTSDEMHVNKFVGTVVELAKHRLEDHSSGSGTVIRALS